VLGLIEVAAVLVLAEIAVRVASTRHRGLEMVLKASTDATGFDDAESLPELMARTMLGFSPGAVQYGFVLNSRGFRTREYAPEPSRDTVRVAALGDSFTFASGGLPHEDHWTTLIETRLAGTADRPVEVLRLGVPDTGPAFQLRLWQLEVARLEPDVVVLGFFVGNDFVDHEDRRHVFGGRRRGIGGRLASASTLYRAVRNLIRIRTSAVGGGTAGSQAGADGGGRKVGRPVPGYADGFDYEHPTFSRDRYLAIESRRMAQCLRSEAEAFDELAGRVLPTVLELVEEVTSTGARCVVMVIPDQYQVNDALAEEIFEVSGTSRDDYDLGRPQRVLREGLAGSGAEVLDLLPVFREAVRGGPLYRPRDTHWNRRGNRLAAAALAEVLAPGGRFGRPELFADGLESGRLDGWSAAEGG
jgi:hypothetical protein